MSSRLLRAAPLPERTQSRATRTRGSRSHYRLIWTAHAIGRKNLRITSRQTSVNLDPEVFLDAAYLIALAHPGDEHHASARQIAEQLNGARILTSRAVLIEVCSALSKIRFRSAAIQLVESPEKSASGDCSTHGRIVRCGLGPIPRATGQGMELGGLHFLCSDAQSRPSTSTDDRRAL